MSFVCSNPATKQPTEILTSAANCIEHCSIDSASYLGDALITKIVALTPVIGVLTVGSAIFASHNSRAMTACIGSCE